MPVRAIRKRITKSPGERRQDVLDAAVRVFAERGVHGTTVAHITQAADVAKGTFYLYFTSKEHLLAVLKEQFVDEILAQASALYEKVGREDWWALVDQTVEQFVDFTLENRDLIHVIVQEGFTPETSELYADCDRRIDAMFAAGIQAGIEAGVFRVSNPELTARLLHHAIQGTMHQAVLYERDVNRDELIASARELVHKVLAP